MAKAIYTNKKQLIEAMKVQITTNDKQCVKALQRIYGFQTEAEKVMGETHDLNGVGFSGTDSKILSSIAKQSFTNGVSEKQMKIVKQCIGKYAGQLVENSIRCGLIRKEGKIYVW